IARGVVHGDVVAGGSSAGEHHCKYDRPRVLRGRCRRPAPREGYRGVVVDDGFGRIVLGVDAVDGAAVDQRHVDRLVVLGQDVGAVVDQDIHVRGAVGNGNAAGQGVVINVRRGRPADFIGNDDIVDRILGPARSREAEYGPGNGVSFVAGEGYMVGVQPN